jgi:hypothetical protein
LAHMPRLELVLLLTSTLRAFCSTQGGNGRRAAAAGQEEPSEECNDRLGCPSQCHDGSMKSCLKATLQF